MDAIERLNKITEIREKMIYYVLRQTKGLTAIQYDKLENKLIQTSFAILKNKYLALNGDIEILKTIE